MGILHTQEIHMKSETVDSFIANYDFEDVGYYAAVIYGIYNPHIQAYEWQYGHNHGTFVSAKKVARAVQRLKDGHDHITADPVHGMTRCEAGYMLANADEILKTINGTKFVYP